MRICCIYWPTSSVGGIATFINNYRAEANRRGDVFHALVSANAPRHYFAVLKEPKRIHGGDTFVDIDGYASHHHSQVKNSIEQINKLYDLVYLVQMCPHPTKNYGGVTHFMPLIEGITLPIVGGIADGYWETYSEWGNKVAPYCKRFIVATPPYTPEDLGKFHPTIPIVYGYGIDPIEVESDGRSPTRRTAWIAQWKDVKGIRNFLPFIPQIEGQVDLYSNGIRYYQLRLESEWYKAVGEDKFQGFNGYGKATFWGWQDPSVIRRVLSEAWFTFEGQGLGRPKYKAYQNGSLNNTIKESLYYQCTPVIPQMTIDQYQIPSESVIGIKTYADITWALNGQRPARPDLGRAWVLDNFHISKIYDRHFGGLV